MGTGCADEDQQWQRRTSLETWPPPPLLASYASHLPCIITFCLWEDILIILWGGCNSSCDKGLPDSWTGKRALCFCSSYLWPSSFIGMTFLQKRLQKLCLLQWISFQCLFWIHVTVAPTFLLTWSAPPVIFFLVLPQTPAIENVSVALSWASLYLKSSLRITQWNLSQFYSQLIRPVLLS